MISNYFKIALRSLLKNKIYSIINLLGLSIGIASCLMILLHVEDESSYDKYHDDGERIYKMVLERIYPDHITNYAIVPHSFGDVIAQDFPEIDAVVRMTPGGGNNVTVVRYVDESDNEKVFEERFFLAADSTFFDVFSIDLIEGNKEEALSVGQNLVISERIAKKYFGDDERIGKILKTTFGDYTVTGVMENTPENSHFEVDFLTPLRTIPFYNNDNFMGFSAHLYVKLKKGASPEGLISKFPEMVKRYAGPEIEANLNKTYEEYVAAGNGYNYQLIPIEDIHLHPVQLQNSYKSGGDINDVYTFIFIAVLILFIACINFMNLSTARSTERAREVGIRKVMGSAKKALITQFLVESVVMAIISTLLALLFVYFALPSFNLLADKNLELNLLNSFSILLIVLVAIIIGSLAGIYPAFVLSSYNPVYVLKGKMATNKSSSFLRNGLVVLQFAISIILISSTLIVEQQLDFIKSKDLGYDKNNTLVIERAGSLENTMESFKNEVRAIPGVKNLGVSSAIPVNQFFGIQFNIPGRSETITTNGMAGDDDYLETMGMEVIAGRNFSEDTDDSLYIIINEKTAALLKADSKITNEELIGQKITTTTGNPVQVIELEIKGIVQDFHYMTLRDQITPFVILSLEGSLVNFPGFMSVKLAQDQALDVISAVEEKWNSYVPGEPFKYSFLDQELYDQYKSEQTAGNIFKVFAGLAIFIACVGLFGLAAYMASLRTKEIGVRKVLGASVLRIVVMLSLDFTKLIVIASFIAIPVAWYTMDTWLNNFSYRIDISLLTLLIGSSIALLIAWLTISYQSIRAATVNPVKSLKSE